MGKNGKLPVNLFISIGVVLALMVLGTAISTGMFGNPSKAHEAEVKTNLHNIQLCVERFAVDMGGSYPQYLIGGEAKWAAGVSLEPKTVNFHDFSECDRSQVSDPLIRMGYLERYPRNPFSRDGLEIHRIQEEIAKSTLDGDPLRNGHELGATLGTRFGPYCTRMGQVLCDARWPTWMYEDQDSGEWVETITGAAVEYRMWDQFAKKEPTGTYMPGMFFYKGVGPIMVAGTSTSATEPLPHSDNDESTVGEWFYDGVGPIMDAGKRAALSTPILPTEIDQYMLGAYGGPRTKGQDVLGESHQWKYLVRGNNPPTQFELDELTFWPGTHSELSPSGMQGDPYSRGQNGLSQEQNSIGNNNGIADGIIMVTGSGF